MMVSFGFVWYLFFIILFYLPCSFSRRIFVECTVYLDICLRLSCRTVRSKSSMASISINRTSWLWYTPNLEIPPVHQILTLLASVLSLENLLLFSDVLGAEPHSQSSFKPISRLFTLHAISFSLIFKHYTKNKEGLQSKNNEQLVLLARYLFLIL